jgi:hypothetical protein
MEGFNKAGSGIISGVFIFSTSSSVHGSSIDGMLKACIFNN